MKQQGKRKTRKDDQISKAESPRFGQQSSFWKNYKVAAFILFVFPFILYGYSITFGYVLDDELVLSENAFVKKGFAGIKDILANDSFTGYLGTQQDLVAGARYRPLSIITFAIEYEFLGLNPQASHFINVLLYGVTALILLWLLSILIPAGESSKWFLGIPFAATLLFVAHPVHTEVVANIKSRDEILSFLFSLLALAATVKYVQHKKKYLLAVSAIMFFLALLAKENAITFLAVIPLALFFFVKDSSLKKLLIPSIPLFATAAAYIILRHQVIGYLLDSGKEITGLMNNPFLEATDAEKYATIFYTLILYVKLLFFPHPLTHDYYPYQIPIINWSDLRAFLPLVFYIAIIIYALVFFRKKTVASFCILYFIITLSIASNLVFSIGTFMNERFLYMPSLAFCILAGYWFTAKIPGWIKNESLKGAVSLGLMAVVISGFSVKTIARVPAWKDSLTLDRAAVKVSANSARANSFMGYGLYRKGLEAKSAEEQLKLFDEATPYVDRALSIYPEYPDALTAKAGLMAGYYQNDRNLEKLLDGFYKIQMARPIPFVDEYLNYLEQVEDKSKLNPFYQKLGTALKKKGNIQKGEYYFRK